MIYVWSRQKESDGGGQKRAFCDRPLRARNEWKFAGVLRRADHSLTVAWWTLLVLRGVAAGAFCDCHG